MSPNEDLVPVQLEVIDGSNISFVGSEPADNFHGKQNYLHEIYL